MSKKKDRRLLKKKKDNLSTKKKARAKNRINKKDKYPPRFAWDSKLNDCFDIID